MADTCDNETRRHPFEDWLLEGHWFVGETGLLYIIPAQGVIADSVDGYHHA